MEKINRHMFLEEAPSYLSCSQGVHHHKQLLWVYPASAFFKSFRKSCPVPALRFGRKALSSAH